jgi:site-specific DNA recombinase
MMKSGALRQTPGQHDNVTAFSYRRVSTKTQTEKYGLVAQKAKIEEFAAMHNIKIVDDFVDAGISGAMSAEFDEDIEVEDDITKREGLLDMIHAFDKYPSVSAVLIFQKSRLWRDDNVKLYVMRELRKRGVEIISVCEPTYSLYSTDPSEYFINGVLDLLDVYERMSINAKLATSRRVKAIKSRQKPAGLLPFGYQYSDDKKGVVVNEKEAEVVRKIFELAAQDFRVAEISAYLIDRGCKTRKGNDFLPQMIYPILHNDFYVGVLTHDGVKYKGRHEPLVNRADWLRINPEYDFGQIIMLNENERSTDDNVERGERKYGV